jgi:arginyl-tRNA synthetase
MVRPDDIDPVLADLASRLRAALAAADLPEADPGFERPRQAEHGDWASTLAMRLAKPAGRNPREIAQAVLDNLELPEQVSDVEMAGPGFLNFRFSPAYYADLVRAVVADGERFGRRTLGEDAAATVNVEFVSANPTGPLHVGAGRWAATGDAIAALLEASGHHVTREYYVNDAGEQVRTFGESVVLVARGEELGERHYRGAYVSDIAETLRAEHGDELFADVDGDAGAFVGGAQHAGDGPGDGALDDGETAVAGDARVAPATAARVGELAVEAMRADIEATLHHVGVDYDVWFSERRGLHESGEVQAAIDALREAGETYEDDGALFLRTEAHGDDKDRVLVRSDGRPTYFAADCAYMRDKWARADVLYYLLGADHHGYVGRLKAAAACLGIPPQALEIRIGQMVNLLRDGEPVRMGKRSGNFVELAEVVDEVGVDVTRYQFLSQSLDTTVDFDLAVVARQSMDNPVYYVQYAHARIASLIRMADARGFDHGTVDDADLGLLVHPAEQELLTAMSRLPEVIAEAAELRATQRLANYAEELAGTFHRFYTECKVLVDDDALARARYWLAVAAKQVLANALGLLRVQAPERM